MKLNRSFAQPIGFAAGLIFVGSASGAQAVDPKIHALCQEAKDYAGCVKAMTTAPSANPDDPLVRLRSAMKQVSSRLASGTSLRDASLTFRPVIDAHAVVPASQQNTLAYQSATLAINLFGRTRVNWQDRITSRNEYNFPLAACKEFDRQVSSFNGAVGKQAITPKWKKWFNFGGSPSWLCGYITALPETLMYNYTIGVLKEGATDPEIISNYKAKRAEAVRLARLGPWQRYLEKKPDLKVWATANPQAAAQEQVKFNRKNPSDPVTLPPLPDSMPHLQGSVVENYIK